MNCLGFRGLVDSHGSAVYKMPERTWVELSPMVRKINAFCLGLLMGGMFLLPGTIFMCMIYELSKDSPVIFEAVFGIGVCLIGIKVAQVVTRSVIREQERWLEKSYEVDAWEESSDGSSSEV